MRASTFILAISLMSSLSAFGKALFFTRSELIQKSMVIAIINMDQPAPAEPVGEKDPFAAENGGAKSASGNPWNYSRHANIRVEKVLKGEVPNEFVMYGNESFICAHVPLSKGRYLAFLTKDGDLWVGTNWQLSLRPIRDGEVEWYISEEQRHPMKFQKLEEVSAQIELALKESQKERR